VNSYIINPFVPLEVVVPTYGRVGISFLYGEKVFSHPIHESALCLANILFAANFAADAVNDVIALAIHIMFSGVLSARSGTGYFARSV
jgi:hypothetical protein